MEATEPPNGHLAERGLPEVARPDAAVVRAGRRVSPLGLDDPRKPGQQAPAFALRKTDTWPEQ